MKHLQALLACCLALSAGPLRAEEPAAPAAPPDFWTETAEMRDARMGWFREARFGMFIHWGLYSAAAGEWNGKPVGNIGEWIMNNAKIPEAEYRGLLAKFNPVKYDAKEWVRIAKDAGMKYIVITTKHHDGFCLWDSALTEWDVMATPYGKDLLKPLAEACAEAGIVFCTYHSIMDWTHPNYEGSSYGTVRKPDMDLYTPYLKSQLSELVSNYGPLGIMWFDGEWEGTWTHERGKDLYQYVRSLQPSIIVNNRVDKGRKGMQGMTSSREFRGDYGTPEQEIPAKGLTGVDWESCMTMNDTWGFKKDDTNWKSSTMLIRNLIDIVSKGGNFLLNVGPTAEGEIPAASVERLQDMGEWMHVNSEAIHGSSASPFGRVPFGRATARAGRIYLHVFDWPADGRLTIPAAGLKMGNVYALADQQKSALRVLQDGGRAVIDASTVARDPHATVIVVEYAGDLPADLSATRVAPGNRGEYKLTAHDAEILGDGPLTLEEANHALGFWTSPENAVGWTLAAAPKGEFDVSIEYACKPGSDGTPVEVAAGAATLSAKVAPTAAWEDFKTVSLGRITLDGSTARVTLTPKAKPVEGVMNLRALTLTPAAKP